MTSSISPEQMAVYRRSAREQWAREQARRDEMRARAWALAKEAAALLRRKFNVARAVVFGSLANESRFGLASDVDLAVWGLTAQNWLRASAAVRDLSHEIEINLVDVGVCQSRILAEIERTGIDV